MSDSEYRKELRRQHKEAGLCCMCDKPVEVGKTMCTHHLEKQKLKAIRRKLRRLDANMCSYCNLRPLVAGKTKCIDCVERDKERYKKTSAEIRERVRLNYQSRYSALKVDVYAAYGNKCACCGEKNDAFFTLDHVNNDGREHRDELGSNGGMHILLWIKDNNYPDTIQLLCANCHLAKTRMGVCPHKIPS